jgi:acyl transferase domain-containing protein/acyl carrier protein
VNDTLSEWHSDGTPRRAGVSSFGLGGTNAHVILEEAPELPPVDRIPPRPFHLLTLSARSRPALREAAARLAEHLASTPSLELEAVSHTLRVGRRAFDHRLAVVCDSAREAASLLSSGELPPATRTSTQAPRVAFMFPGGGAHHARMGRELYASEPVFRAELDRCAELLVPHLGLDIRTEMFGEGSLERPTRGLPALFALEYALAKLWMAWGVVPGVMIGHSVGEYAAACLAGVFRLEDALALVALRGRLFETLPRGAMLGVALRPPALRALLDGMPEVAAKLSLAAINAPELCVVSGPSGAIEAFQERLVERGVESRRLHIDVAAHSGVVERIVGEFQQAVGSVRPSAPRLPFVSNLTGRLITTQEATDPHYWGRHLRETVRFSDGLALLLEEPELVLLEVGAGTTLSSLARSHPSRKHQPVLASLPHPRDPQPESRQVLTALGALWSHGVALDWAAFDAQRAPRRVSLPTYPFQRQRFWLDAPAGAHGAARAHALEGWFFVPSWRRSVPPPRRPMEHERCWVLFVDEGDVGSRLAEALRAEGRGVVTVRPGARFSQASDTSYTLEPSSPSDYSTLVRELERRGSWPGRVVHLWNLTRPDSPGDFARSFDSLVVLARVLGERPKAVRIDVVSSGLHEVSGEEVLQPRKALSLGPIRVAGKEYPGLRLRSIDVVWPSSAMAGDGLVARLRAELECGAEEAVIALRGAHRWVQAFEPVSLPAPEPASRRPRERGVYWITGGLGGLGRGLAEHLGRTLQARLVLTGRSAFPEREAWDRWLAEHGPDDRTSRTIHTLRGILSAGGEVLVLQADITDEKASRAVLERAEHAFGHVNGVIHAAGVFDVALLGDTTRERMERVLAPKVLGAEVLERVFSSRTLDFMAFCSSLNAVLGPPGLADYCAANAYLDALAARRARDGHFTVSIGWDGWREVGMAAAMRMPDLAWAGEGMGNADGVAAFERILARSLPQVLVSTGELSARLEAVARGSEPASGRASTPEASTTNPERESTHVAPRNDMERVLAGLWRMLLGVEVVGVHDNFVELGGHSLLGSRLLVQIRAAFDIALPLKTLFDKPTVAELAAHLSALMAARDMLPIEPLGADEEEERW